METRAASLPKTYGGTVASSAPIAIHPAALSLANLDELPNSALVSGKVAAQVLGCSYNNVFRMSRDGRLAKPVKIGMRSTRWRVGDLRTFLAGLKPSQSA